MSRDISSKEIVRVELKYCERCGRMWLRTMGDMQVYCDACQPAIAELPVRKPMQSVRLEAAKRDNADACSTGKCEQKLQSAGGAA
ncbi:MAG TPA: hypothetical protein VFO39_19340 [Candidatus Sulfotelmatobacter sp.]|nr:hypothetical protein [Candidatus Sulfotelmatobacter sp.]